MRALALPVLALVLLACGGNPTSATNSPSPQVSTEPAPGPGSTEPVGAVEALALNQPPLCEAADPTMRYSAAAGCPVTLRMQDRLRALASGFDPVCRCQTRVGTPQLVPVGATRVNAVVKIDFGTASALDGVYFAVIKLGGHWFVDDTNCSDPTTSIYVDPLPRCH